ncbi:MAG TPA: serine hydrolase domain-containing protein [Caulobacteraceae bacterium]|nr:serine hydrolase domain-containing protein [Caulobacteraceae bacterium]
MLRRTLISSIGAAALAGPAAAQNVLGFPRVDAAKAGWNADALADVLAYARGQKSTGFMIVQNRQVIAEENWPLPADAAQFKANFTYGTSKDGALLEDVASAQKSYIAVIAAATMDRGYLDLDNKVSFYAGTGWSKATPVQEAAITVRHLMEMSSGLTEQLTYEAPPGTKFFYNTPAYAIMKPVLEGAVLSALDDLTRRFLTEPAGMVDTAWRKRPGAFAGVGNPTGLVTTPRDMIRLGQLVLDDGKAIGGRQVISKAGLDSLFKPTKTNPAYGHLWWLNGGGGGFRPGSPPPKFDGRLIPTAPADLVAALGAQGRKVYVVPSKKLVVVRMGQAPGAAFDNEIWTRLTKAMGR